MFFPATTTNRRVWVSWWIWLVAPCTLAIVTGPLISLIYSLTRSEFANDGAFSITQPIRGLLCIMMFFSLFLSMRLRLLELSIVRPQILLAMFAVFTSILSPYPYENITFAARMVFMALVFVCAYNISQNKLISEKWLIINAWVILIFMTISQLIGLATGKTVVQYESSYATAGFIERASIVATLVISTLPVFLKYFPYYKWVLAGIILALFSLFLAMQRTPLIAATVALMIILARYFYPLRRRVHWSKVMIAVIILCVIIVIGLQTPAGADFLKRVSELDPREGSGSGRYIFWRISLNHIINRDVTAQIMGEGFGSVRDVIFKHYGLAIKSHTDWLDFPFAFGIFGFIAIAWWYYELTRFVLCLSILKYPAFQGALSAVVIFFLLSIGQGGESYDPALALTYTALGYWAGHISYNSPVAYAGYASYWNP